MNTKTMPYAVASFPAWRDAARHAIDQGQSENDFVSHCHPDNRHNARTAYRVENAISRATGKQE